MNLGRSSAAFAGRPHHSMRIMADLILHDEHGEVDRTHQQSPGSKWSKWMALSASFSPGVWDPFRVDMPVITRRYLAQPEPSRSADKATPASCPAHTAACIVPVCAHQRYADWHKKVLMYDREDQCSRPTLQNGSAELCPPLIATQRMFLLPIIVADCTLLFKLRGGSVAAFLGLPVAGSRKVKRY